MKLKIHHLTLLGAVSLLGGCFGSEDNSTNSSNLQPSGVYAVVTPADYSTYAVQTLGSGSAVTFKDFGSSASSGLALNSADGILYIINQGTGELQAWKDGSIQFDVNVGATSNPYQALKIGSKLYVVRWNSNKLLVLNASNGSTLDSIDLSKSANREGAVSPAKAAFIGGKLWILAQRYSSYTYDSGMVIITDTGADTAPRGIALAAKNPQGIAVVGSNVYVASHGSWDTATADGGFDLFNAATGAWTKRLTATAVGKPADLVAVAGSLWAIVYTDAYTTTKVVPVSTVDGSQGAAVAGLSAANSLATDGTYLWVSDRAAGDKQAVWKLNGSTGAAISSVKTTYPPTALAIVQ